MSALRLRISTEPGRPLIRLPIDSRSDRLCDLSIRLFRRMQFIPPIPNNSQSRSFNRVRERVPNETIPVTTDGIRAGPIRSDIFVELEYAGVHSASCVQWRGAVEIVFRVVEHVREEGMRIEETYVKTVRGGRLNRFVRHTNVRSVKRGSKKLQQSAGQGIASADQLSHVVTPLRRVTLHRPVTIRVGNRGV